MTREFHSTPPRDETPILIAEKVVRILDGDGLELERLREVVHYVKEATQADACTLLRHQSKTGDLYLTATDGLSTEMEGTFIVNTSEGLNGLVVRENHHLAVRDGPSHPAFRFVPSLMEEDFHSFLGVPVTSGKRVVGVLSIQTGRPRDFSREDIALLKNIATHIAPVAKEVFKRQNRKSRDTRDDTPTPEGARSIHGRALSPGCFAGEPFPMERGLRLETIFTPPSRGAEREHEALRDAVRGVIVELRHDAREIAGSEGYHIVRAYSGILKDRELGAQVAARIDAGDSAAEAIRVVTLKIVRDFERQVSGMLAARATDFRDIANRLLHALGIRMMTPNVGDRKVVALARTLLPGDLLRMGADHLGAVVITDQGIYSHLAILCRSLGVPAIQVDPKYLDELVHAKSLLADGTDGVLLVNPAEDAAQAYQARAIQIIALPQGGPENLEQPVVTVDGARIQIGLNAGLEEDFDRIEALGPDDVGLYRTEISFMSMDTLPSLEEQVEHYEGVLERAGGRRVTLRTFDFGGDKIPEAIRLAPEENPMMGCRSTRLMLVHEEIFSVQLEALLRVSTHGPMAVLLPMISTVEELNLVLDEINMIKNDLEGAGVEFDHSMPIGVMLEVPSVMFLIDELSNAADFFSVGSNDLVQYLMAADRTNPSVSRFYQWNQPAVLAALDRILRHCRRNNRPTTLCGEMANNPWAAMLLVGMGYDHLSIDRHSIPLIKWTLRQVAVNKMRDLAQSVIHATSSTETLELLYAALRGIRKENPVLAEALGPSLDRLSQHAAW